ncbi:DUF2612 domain-containing protein [Pluralibacter gergoviae]|uniref:DUF2612 domain-containing protein n=1 Tax=Pluralibacter gergoviae TaxID=61647 RepID=A0AAI9DLA7_PLUGE|nr:DUF2612 domain-containing protein [Pluralibacter gergoviae]EKV9907704.1 DUF2612 domain-containing protein [Pluralibacter gergoviae]EKW7276827.1 DUF2612 domain-containing protein [Pluralibacter gergoviae]ELD4293964.1 DUF2612 domain-containing protein [Pluralibacter gergoviae]ELD4304743.1 DUF2612 domain-containing protein [Pluralibacter gergoviae]
MFDHKKKVRSRVYWQYKNSPQLNKWLQILPEIANDTLESQIEKIERIIEIDIAAGEQLDICGRIAGIPRRPKILKLGICEMVIADDELFRLIIKGKITKNNGDATIDNVKLAGDYLFGGSFTILDGLDMTMLPLWWEKYLPDLQFVKLVHDMDLLPRPQGVGMRDPRVIRYIPWGFGRNYQNFEHAGFWDGGDLVNYGFRISLWFDADAGILRGQITSIQKSVNLSGIEVKIDYTSAKGNAFSHYVATDGNGSFADALNDYGIYTAQARAQIFTPTCTTEDVISRPLTFTYYIETVVVKINYNNASQPVFSVDSSKEPLGAFTIDYGDGVDSADYKFSSGGSVILTRNIPLNQVLTLTIKKSWTINFNTQNQAYYNSVLELVLVAGLRTNLSRMFSGTQKLTKIDSGAFDDLPFVESFEQAFSQSIYSDGRGGMGNLSEIPERLFDKCTRVKTFKGTFSGQSKLRAIPAGLFDNCPEVTIFQDTFSHCTLISEIPAGLFDGNIKVISFANTFKGCQKIESIPVGLFKNNSLVTSFLATFAQSYSLKSIPAGLFDNNPLVTTFGGVTVSNGKYDGANAVFSECKLLTSVPAGLFDCCPNIVELGGVLALCPRLQVNINELFKLASYPAVTFIPWAFNKSSLITGSGNALIAKLPNAANHKEVFTGCSLLSDYASIPSDWK